LRETLLHDGWIFRQTTPGPGYWRPNEPELPWRPASVPGCVHDDLIRAGVIADPFLRQHEAGCQWVDEEDWTYRTEFEWSGSPDLPVRCLRFDGLDTVCEIWLNGEKIATHDNMFLPLEVEVTDRLLEGKNELEVRFLSAVRTGDERRRSFFEREAISQDTAFFDERAFVRKAPYMSGWDWGPRLVSCGIWRPVRLLEFAARILSFEVFAEPLEAGRWRVWSEAAVDGAESFYTRFDGRQFEGGFDVVLEEPRLWWPNGEGEPNLYEAEAWIEGHRMTRKVGLRTVRLLREEDSRGESFEFEVNGRRIFARGANWIPNDSFPSRITGGDYRSQIELAKSLGMNMLRVWGGGLYEDDAFYDACDELGILVWQDFPFACSYYPDDPEFQSAVRVEALFHVERLRSRPSLAIWCGNNECDMIWEGKWGGEERTPGRYFGDDVFGDTLAGVCRDLDPGRAYVRSSPIGGQKDDRAWGNVHNWDVWHGRGYWVHYAESHCRFCTEFGFASSCRAESWRLTGIQPSEHPPEDAVVRWHDKTHKPWDIFKAMVEAHYPPSTDLEEWIYFSQLNQRDALRFGIEHYRTSGYCRGTLIWQLNDCWPVESWAVQDYSRNLKPAGWELVRLYGPLMVSLRIEGEELVVRAANDGCARFEGEIELGLVKGSGEQHDRKVFAAALEPGQPKELLRVPLDGIERNRMLACAQVRGIPETVTWRTLDEPRNMRLSAPSFSLAEETLRPDGLVVDLVLEGGDGRAITQIGGEIQVPPNWNGRGRTLAGPFQLKP
jgi:beta-mannosidase